MAYIVREPQVSIIIVNWNYARFVADAINSVQDQTYRNYDCLVIDNASSDRSSETILEAIDGHPQFAFQQLPANLGHLGAALWSLDRVRGEFVLFLDADDILFPDYLVDHLQVHLSTAFPTGFTCSNCVYVNANGAQITGGNCWSHDAWKTGASSLRPMERTLSIPAFDGRDYGALSEATRYLPAKRLGWFWCPGSSNLYRRALLERVRPKLASETFFGSVDGLFLPLLHAITGTNLIDRPLSAYRVHDSNSFALLPPLMGAHISRPSWAEKSAATARLAVMTVIDGFETFPAGTADFWNILDIVATMNVPPPDFNHPDVKAAFGRRYNALAQYFGERRVIRELRSRMERGHCLDIARTARKGVLPFATRRRAMSMELDRNIRRLLKKT